ncbi:MAG TPA: hypothetical protein VN969_02975 [Streptosporangiaceae bacterium]|nr:hypothetical protein [Streptosporangiaceae bacterium]
MRGRPATNHELAALIKAGGRSHASLARRVNVAAAALHGLDLRYDQASVYWWLRGRVPEEPIPALLAAIFSEWLGCVVQVPDLGFTDPGGHLGLTLPVAAAEAVTSVSELWRYVLRRRVFLGAGFAIGASVGAGFEWHFAPAPSADAVVRHGGTRMVGLADVERIRQARTEFETMDRLHGGGHAFTWLVDYLDREVTPLLSGQYPAQVGRELFAASSGLTELAGWMAFDQGKSHGLAQRFFIQALGLARQAGDRAYGAHIVSNLATQALFLDHGTEATRLARAAISGAGHAATPTLLARLGVTEARGFALLGDRREARAAIRRADKAMDRSDPTRDPAWLASYSSAHHAGSAMHALRDVELYREAAARSDAALDLPEMNVRTRALHTTLLATVQAGQGEIEAACSTAGRALAAAPELTSARLNERLRDFSRRITAYPDQVNVREYLERSAELLPS